MNHSPFSSGTDTASERADDHNCASNESWLVAAIRRDSPDPDALDELTRRTWKPLFARCQMLTLNREHANELAQEAWRRVLKARLSLQPDRNFPAYLNRVAMDVWRDQERAQPQIAPGERRLASADADWSEEPVETPMMGDTVLHVVVSDTEAHSLLCSNVDGALEQLTPRLRGVVVARYLLDESCAEIGRRYGRTEQTVISWVRQAVQAMKLSLEQCHGKPLRAVMT